MITTNNRNVGTILQKHLHLNIIQRRILIALDYVNIMLVTTLMFMIWMMLDHKMEMSPCVLDVLIRAPLNIKGMMLWICVLLRDNSYQSQQVSST